MEIGLINVWVGGDGEDWSCSNWMLYKVPKEAFDYNMLIGRLNTKQDLELLIESTRKEYDMKSMNINDVSFIDVYVSHDGNWAGLPPTLYQIPIDVFNYLQIEDRSKLIGRLNNSMDLEKLIIQTRKDIQEELHNCNEMKLCRLCKKLKRIKNDNVDNICNNCNQLIIGSVEIAKVNTELKSCGHICTISSLKDGCCKCLDIRPILSDSNTYPIYIDGYGWADTATRGAGYCPYCKY